MWAVIGVAAVGVIAFFVTHKTEPPAAPLKPVAETKPASPSPTSTTPTAPSAPVAREKSIAVLAFENLSGDKDNEYFADGISEELLNVLAKVPGLFVSARTSAFSFKGKNVPVPQIARELGVTYVIEGSVRKGGTNVRITAQLINAANGFHLWSDTYTRELKDIFAVQDEIARDVARNLQLTLGTSAPAATVMVNPEVYRLYVEGRQAWNIRFQSGTGRAESLYQQALAIEPKFARAMVGLADVLLSRNNQPRFGLRHAPILSDIITKAQAALTIDPNLAEAYVSIAEARKRSWQFAEAEKEFRRAITLSPNYPTGHHWFGLFLLERGLMDEALAELKVAVQLDPLAPQILSNYGTTLNLAGRSDEGLTFVDRALGLQPDARPTQANRLRVLSDMGKVDEAVALARSMMGGNRSGYFGNLAARTFAQAGLRAEAESAMAQATPDLRPPARWAALAILGRYEDILTALNPDIIDNSEIQNLLFQPDWDPIRNDRRFQIMITELGAAEAHERAQKWRAQHPRQVATK